MRRLAPLVVSLAAGLGACSGPASEPDPDWRHYADKLGDPIDGLDAGTQALYDKGIEVMARDFTPETGLGPTFNADSCHSCHGVPIPGGAAPRYRDFFLVRKPRWDDTLVDVGSNGVSPVRNMYGIAEGHMIHVGEPEDTVVYARRNAPPMFGVGLFEFVDDAHILTREDPDDADGDGISGRANYEQGRVGRFGVKAQASGIESFNRGAMLNQMGLTSNPLFHVLPDDPIETASLDVRPQRALEMLTSPRAWAQVSAPGEPTTDDDGVPDPELSDEDQLALLIFSTYIAPPRPTGRTDETRAGAKLFEKVGCADCHVPALESRIGPLQAYTDLLIHDLGEENSDGLKAGFANPTEFRTSPLWGVGMTAPYMHDGAADTIEAAVDLHGAEGSGARDAFQALDDEDQALIVTFLRSLGPYATERPGLVDGADHFPADRVQPGPDAVGESGGPDRALTTEEEAQWLRGRALFDKNVRPEEGLGTAFNADSCRACHQDPVLGGAGGIDTNVLRIGGIDDTGNYVHLGSNALPRVIAPGSLPVRKPDETAIIEGRQPPSLLGLGRLEEVSDEAILANVDPTDMDGDGISGRARFVGEQIGRFGWKAQIPTLTDFAADALLNEVGLTLPADVSDFTGTDEDGVADPELPASTAEDLAFYMRMLAPPTPASVEDAGQVERGAVVFGEVGCDSCHVPELDGVPAYTDLLLHDVASIWEPLVEQDPGVEATEFRTPPLWGIVDTPPYLHSGLASTLDQAVELGHHGEAQASREAFEALSDTDREALIAFLKSL